MAHRNRWFTVLKNGGSFHCQLLVITRWYHQWCNDVMNQIKLVKNHSQNSLRKLPRCFVVSNGSLLMNTSNPKDQQTRGWGITINIPNFLCDFKEFLWCLGQWQKVSTMRSFLIRNTTHARWLRPELSRTAGFDPSEQDSRWSLEASIIV